MVYRLYILICFCGKNYLKKSSDLAFSIVFSILRLKAHLSGFELKILSAEFTSKQFVS